MIKVLAAGSLRNAFSEIFESFPEPVEVGFGPAGILRERIENGEIADLFASASISHPEALYQKGLCDKVIPFAYNRLCITTTIDYARRFTSWLELLLDSKTLIGTSTPGCDPSGDYTWQLYDKIATTHSGASKQLQERSRMLVGGRDNSGNAGKARQELLAGNVQALIGYTTSATAGNSTDPDRLCIIEIPEDYNIKAIYAFAVINGNADSLLRHIRSTGRQILIKWGFKVADAIFQ